MSPRVAQLAILYFVQGLPLGIQLGVLPILMRARGESRQNIALASALALPWILKVFVAPTVDTVYSKRLGRRRSWILPLQALVSLVLASLAFIDQEGSLLPLFVGLFVMNAAAATMDVAVDGLAIDLLSDEELGPGNAAQIGGFKLGMLFASGVALQLLRLGSWGLVFFAMSLVTAFAFVMTWRMREPETLAIRPDENVSVHDLFALIRRLFEDKAMRALALVVLLYKAGESMADSQWKPFLVDSGFSAEDIGLYVSLFGMIASTLGSFAGGALGAGKRSLVRLIFLVAAIRVFPLLGQAFVAATGASHAFIVGVSLAENFVGGLLTTLVFAWMMSSADPTRAGTSFTVLSTLDSIGKALLPYTAGLLADEAGDTVVFACAAAISAAFLLLYRPVRAHELRGAYKRFGLVSELCPSEARPY